MCVCMLRGVIQTLFCPQSLFYNKGKMSEGVEQKCCPEVESVEDTEDSQDAIFALG